MSIVDRIRPHIQGLVENNTGADEDKLAHLAVHANIRASVDHLRHGSQVLESLIENEGLQVVGAEYNIETGDVEFIEGV